MTFHVFERMLYGRGIQLVVHVSKRQNRVERIRFLLTLRKNFLTVKTLIEIV